jgi:glycine hydroxymethyltransferase
LKESEMVQVAGFIAEALKNTENEAELLRIKGEVNALMKKFPQYAHRLV